jgi:tRNA-splicing ligase RtcB
MRMTVFNASPQMLGQRRAWFRAVLEDQTCFGAGGAWSSPRTHEVLDDLAWTEHPQARRFKDTAWRQLGTSGSGNHFVEFGALTVHAEIATPLGNPPHLSSRAQSRGAAASG